MKEKRDLYDQFKNLTNKYIYKGDEVPVGYYYLTVIILIENFEDEVLIQKRSENKGGRWALTGGHPTSGQSSIEGILTEVYEEIGFKLNKKEVKLITTIKTENDFIDLYYIKTNLDIKNAVLQSDEVSDLLWVTKEYLENQIKEEVFHKGHSLVYKKIREEMTKKDD